MNEQSAAAQSAGAYAQEQLRPALEVLSELMQDHDQTGSVRISAAKSVVDCALKLGDNGSAEQLARLDAALDDIRSAIAMSEFN